MPASARNGKSHDRKTAMHRTSTTVTRPRTLMSAQNYIFANHVCLNKALKMKVFL